MRRGANRSSRKIKIAVIAVLGVLAVVGVGSAAIPSSDKVIHSCYNASSNPSGQLRVIDAEAGAKCSKNEKALNFNQQGPKGDKGDKGDACLPSNPACVGPQGSPGADGRDGAAGKDGADGAAGKDGAPGASDAYFGENRSTTVGILSDGNYHVIVSRSLPAGSYALTATAVVQDDDHDATVDCFVTGGSFTRYFTRVALVGGFTPDENVKVWQIATASFSSGGTAELKCATPNDADGVIGFDGRILAIKVGAIH